jgi:hypothetical protein
MPDRLDREVNPFTWWVRAVLVALAVIAAVVVAAILV